MRRLVPILLLLGLLGCAGSHQVPTVPVTRAPEVRALPPDPADEALPPGTPPGETIEPLEAGSCYDLTGLHGGNTPCPPNSGLLVSEGRAARDGLYRIRYRELRIYYEADRTTWSAQRALYEGVIARDQTTIRALQPTWWEHNALAIGVVGGFLLGAGGITALVLSTR